MNLITDSLNMSNRAVEAHYTTCPKDLQKPMAGPAESPAESPYPFLQAMGVTEKAIHHQPLPCRPMQKLASGQHHRCHHYQLNPIHVWL